MKFSSSLLSESWISSGEDAFAVGGVDTFVAGLTGLNPVCGALCVWLRGGADVDATALAGTGAFPFTVCVGG
jgi:hypothetical protein